MSPSVFSHFKTIINRYSSQLAFHTINIVEKKIHWYAGFFLKKEKHNNLFTFLIEKKYSYYNHNQRHYH
jgi:hypothetical protein